MRKAVEEFYKKTINSDINERVAIKGTTICDAIESFAKIYHKSEVKNLSSNTVSQAVTLRWNLWKDSEEGQTAHDYETLTEEKYLHNRIYRAFMAGANCR